MTDARSALGAVAGAQRHLANGPGVCEPSEGSSWDAGHHDIFAVATPGHHVRVIMIDPAGRTVFEKHRNWFHGRQMMLARGRYRPLPLYADGTSGETALVVTRARSPG
jgi:hypothetical protein